MGKYKHLLAAGGALGVGNFPSKASAPLLNAAGRDGGVGNF
ncbi:hypothetical protein ACP70R_015464 [Stipagrostis hirtigluma subsp. patula]